MHRIVAVQRVVVQELGPQQHCRHTHPGVDQQAECDQKGHQTRRDDAARLVEAVDQRIEDDACREDHPRLEAAPGAEVTMELDIETEQENEWNQQLGKNSWDQMFDHQASFP